MCCVQPPGSESDYSYKSFVSAGGTRHVTRRRKRGDGTYSAAHSYHSSQDAEGRARRQKRRAVRKAEAVKELVARNKRGERNADSESEYSYKSFVSAGGTRHVTRRRKRADGTYSAAHSYHSSKDAEGRARRKKRRQQREVAYKKEMDARFKKGKRNADSASDYSYKSFVSAGGTRHVTRRRKRGDGTYSAAHSYHSSQDAEGMARRKKRRNARAAAEKLGKRKDGE